MADQSDRRPPQVNMSGIVPPRYHTMAEQRRLFDDGYMMQIRGRMVGKSASWYYEPGSSTHERGRIAPTAVHHTVTEKDTPWLLYALDIAVLIGLVLLWRGHAR